MTAKRARMLTPFRPADAAEVVRWPGSLAEARAWAGATLKRRPGRSQLARWHAEPGVHPFVMRSGRTPVAYGELWVDRAAGEVELARIIVRPSHRSRGLGRLLVTRLLRAAAAFDVERAFVRVVPGNAPALRCYEAAGFERVRPADARRFNRDQPVQYLWLHAATGRRAKPE